MKKIPGNDYNRFLPQYFLLNRQQRVVCYRQGVACGALLFMPDLKVYTY
jgi:hypothetical protein